MADAEFKTFEDFWPFYVREHANKTNRVLHFVGTSLAMSCVAAAAITRRTGFLLAAPLVGYGFAWVGHFVIEGNRPATFQYPLMSAASDFRMWYHMAKGQLWSGDPLEELNLDEPLMHPAPEAVETAVAAE